MRDNARIRSSLRGDDDERDNVRIRSSLVVMMASEEVCIVNTDRNYGSWPLTIFELIINVNKYFIDVSKFVNRICYHSIHRL